MRPGTTHVVTKGSNVWLDDTNSEYLRLPRSEGPRERAEWSDERAGPLQDAVWHPMVSWRIGPNPTIEALQDKLRAARPTDVPRGVVVSWPDLPDGLMIDYLDEDGEPQTSWFPEATVVVS